MAINCVYDPARKQFGYGEAVFNRLRSFLGDSVPTKGKFTNVVRRLGTDDVRMVNLKDENGKAFFGANIKEVSDLDFSKGPIPNNTIVRVPTAEGEKFFISNKDGVMATPSRWEYDSGSGRIMPNADWDQINPNVTRMKQYTRDEEGIWRVVKDDETGDFLNIQNPSKVEREFSEIVDKGYDAIEVDGGYQLINESSQAINPKTITDKIVRDRVYHEIVSEKPSIEEIGRKLMDMDMPKRAAYSIAGGVSGDIMDEYDENSGLFWGGALGLALGSKTSRSKVRGTFTRSGRARKDKLQQAMEQATQAEREFDKIQFAVGEGYKGNTTDMKSVNDFLKFQYGFTTAKRNGEVGWFKTLFKNKIFESGQGLLTSMGVTGGKLFQVMRGFESAPVAMYAKFGVIQTKFFGENAKEAFKQNQLNFVRSLPRFKELGEEDAMQAFGSAVYRLRTYGGSIDESGKFIYNSDISGAKKAYSDDIVRDIDQRLLNDPEAKKVYDAVSEFYDNVYDETVDILKRKLSRDIDNIGDGKVYDLMNEIYHSGLTFKAWKDVNPKRAELLSKIQKGKYGDQSYMKQHEQQISRIGEVINDLQRFDSLKGRYVPQKFSVVKESLERKKWLGSKPHLRSLDSDGIAQKWEEEKVRRMLANNSDKWRLLEFSPTDGDASLKYFSDWDSAKSRFDQLLDELPDQRVANNIQARIASQETSIDDYIRKDTNGYFLDTPDWLKESFPEGLYGKNNVSVMTDSNRVFTTYNMTAKADFFDRPRKGNLPSEFLELDMEKLGKFYSEDMGIRLHAIDNNLYDRSDFHRNWRKQIHKEMTGRVDEQEFQRQIADVESWLSVMQRQRPERKIAMSPEDSARMRVEMQTKARNDNLLNSAAKLFTAPFNYGTTLYSMFTPLVLGPFVTSWRGVLGQYGRGITSPKKYAKELKAMTDELYKMGTIEKKFDSYRTQYKNEYNDALLGDSTSWRRRLSDFSDKGTQFSADLSFTRLFGMDPENMGLARLLLGGMLDVSGAEAGLITMSAFRHLDDLMGAVKKLSLGEEAMIGRTKFTRETLQREFNYYGITDMDSFTTRAKNFDNQFDNFVDHMKGNRDVGSFTPEFYGDMTKVINTVVDQYHARGKTARPLGWVDNVWGRALSRYSVYAQNFGVQTTGQRMYRPMKDWAEKYKMTDENVPVYKLAYYASTGNDAKFKELFGANWEGAYNDFPVETINNFLKVFGALAVGKAMMITRGGMLDLTGIAANELTGNDDYEAWRNVNRQRRLGVYADTGEPFYISDVFSGDVQGFDLFKAFLAVGESAAQLGFSGRLGQVLTNDLKFTDGGVMELTPLTGVPNDFYRRLGKLRTSPLEDLPSVMSRELVDLALLRGTPFGTFYDARQPLANTLLQKPKNRGIQMFDINSGIRLDATLNDY